MWGELNRINEGESKHEGTEWCEWCNNLKWLLRSLVELTIATINHTSTSIDWVISWLKWWTKIIDKQEVLLEALRGLNDWEKREKIASELMALIQESKKNTNNALKWLRETNEELKKRVEELSRDSLTWLYNRKIFEERVNLLIDKYNETWEVFSVALLDIDYFKSINDWFWHGMWDYVLKFFAKKLRGFFEWEDCVFRYWWEEFVVLFKGNKDDFYEKIEKFRLMFTKKKIVDRRSESREWKGKFERVVTFSAWIWEYKWDSLDQFIDDVDKKLYEAKRSWRNTIRVL